METKELWHETALAQGDPDEQPQYGDPEDGGALLDMDEEKAAQWLVDRWDSQTNVLKPFLNQWMVNVLRRNGVPGVRKTTAGNVYVPKNATADNVPSFNKLADLLRRLAAMLFSDPPASDAVPHSDSNDDKEAAEFSTQVLQEIDSEAQLDDAHTAERAFDRGSDYGSGFVEYYVDPKGGGRVPIQVKAGYDESGREAMHVDEAVYDPMFAAVGVEQEWMQYRPRFVRKDGTLTEERAEAATRWSPRIRSRIYSSRNVRFLPITSRDIWDAEGVLITDFPSWDELLKDHPELAELPSQEVQELLSKKPKNHTELMSPTEIRALDAKVKGDKPIWRIRCYFRQCPLYPKGAHVVLLGGKKIITQDPWVANLPDGSIEHLEIPLTQYSQLEEGGRGGAYRVGMGEILGGSNELRTYIWGQVIHNLERIRNQAILMPWMGKVHSKMLHASRMGGKNNVLPFQPGYKPEYEQIPDLPSVVFEAFQTVSTEMDDSSGLQQIARGLEDGSVESGRHAFAIIGQVKQGLATLIRNIERGWVRAGRIKMQLIRAFYTQEQTLLWSGDDDEWKQKAWRRADLGSTRDVRLKAGTLTMYTQAQKEQLAHEWHGMGLIDDDRYHEIIAGNMGATLGLQQDPRRSRIKRQLNRWREGPPEEWQPPAPAFQQAMQPNGMVDPLSGQPQTMPAFDALGAPVIQPMLDPGGNPTFQPDPLLQEIFRPVPADLVPVTAQLRFNLIAETMNSKKYLEMHPAWRSALDLEYYRMQQAVAAAQAMMQPQPAPGGSKAEAPKPKSQAAGEQVAA